MTAAAHALAEGDPELAAQRLMYARDASPDDPVVLRHDDAAFCRRNRYPAAARAARDWVRVERDNPAAHRFLARIYEAMGSGRPALDSAALRRSCGRATRTAGRGSGGSSCAGSTATPRSRRWSEPARPEPTPTRCSTWRWRAGSVAMSAGRSRPASRRRCSSPSGSRRLGAVRTRPAQTERRDRLPCCLRAGALLRPRSGGLGAEGRGRGIGAARADRPSGLRRRCGGGPAARRGRRVFRDDRRQAGSR